MNSIRKTPFERLFAVMTKPWIVIMFLGLVAASFFWIDKPLAILVYGGHFQEKWPWLKLLTAFGKKSIYLVGFFVVALMSRFLFQNKYWERISWFLLSCILFSSFVCLILKVLFGRARPELYFSEQLYGFFGLQKNPLYWSFPSGHTTTAMAIVFGLSALFPRYMMGFVVCGLLVAASRIILLQHYLSDVLMASYLALIEVGFLYYWFSTLVLDNKRRIS